MLYLLAQAQDNSFANTVDRLARTPLSKILIFAFVVTLLRFAVQPMLSKTAPHLRGTGGYKFASFVNEASDALVYAGIFVFFVIRPFCLQTFRIPSGSMFPKLKVGDLLVVNKAVYRYTDPLHNDIVVFRPPKRAVQLWQIEDDQVNVDFVKRCIGVPGDVIEFKNDVLYRNGKAIDEPWKHFTSATDMEMDDFVDLPEDEHKARPKMDWKLVKYEGKYWPLYMQGDNVNGTEITNPEFEVPAMDTAKMQKLKNLPAEPIPPNFYLMIGDNRYYSADGRSWGLVPRDDIVGRSELIWLPFSHIKITR